MTSAGSGVPPSSRPMPICCSTWDDNSSSGTTHCGDNCLTHWVKGSTASPRSHAPTSPGKDHIQPDTGEVPREMHAAQAWQQAHQKNPGRCRPLRICAFGHGPSVTQRTSTRTPENMGKLQGWRDAQTAMLPCPAFWTRSGLVAKPKASSGTDQRGLST
jgi:hypothetical protein